MKTKERVKNVCGAYDDDDELSGGSRDRPLLPFVLGITAGTHPANSLRIHMAASVYSPLWLWFGKPPIVTLGRLPSSCPALSERRRATSVGITLGLFHINSWNLNLTFFKKTENIFFRYSNSKF